MAAESHRANRETGSVGNVSLLGKHLAGKKDVAVLVGSYNSKESLWAE
jgi:hypothetical protein